MGTSARSRARLLSREGIRPALGVVLLAVVTTAGCGAAKSTDSAAHTSDSKTAGVTVHGDLTVTDYGTPRSLNDRRSNVNVRTGDPCTADGGYSDIAEGAAVTVYDPSGKVIGVGSLDAGTVSKDVTTSGSALTTGPPYYPYECAWTFTVEDLPAVNFYGVAVSHRGTINVPKSELDTDGVHLNLGQ
jgi:hypothetical protein